MKRQASVMLEKTPIDLNSSGVFNMGNLSFWVGIAGAIATLIGFANTIWKLVRKLPFIAIHRRVARIEQTQLIHGVKLDSIKESLDQMLSPKNAKKRK